MGKFKVRVSLPRGEFNQDKCSILLHATQFYAKKILGTRLANLINVKVDVRKTTLEYNTLGVCHMAITGSKRQRKFRIVLNNRKDLHAQLETLAHEMVHVRQFCRREITESETYNNYDEYMKQPHEVEAYRLQEELLDEVKKKAIG